MPEPTNVEVTAAGRSALASRPTTSERLQALARALEDARQRLPLYYADGRASVADDLLRELREELEEIAADLMPNPTGLG